MWKWGGWSGNCFLKGRKCGGCFRVLGRVGGNPGSYLRVRRKGLGCLRVRRRVGGSTGSSVEHRALVGPALLGGQLLGGFTLRKQGDNGPQGRGGMLGGWGLGMKGVEGEWLGAGR